MMRMWLRRSPFRKSPLSRIQWMSKTELHPRPFSSSAVSPDTRIARTLYRQLLQWCDRTDNRIPLSQFMPPMHVTAPELIDPYYMELLSVGPSSMDNKTVSRVRKLLPAKTEMRPKQLTVPIYHADDLKDSLRALYRINGDADRTAVTPGQQKQRTQTAFQALKSLNALSVQLGHMEDLRLEHSDREGVAFRVGQVVRHQHERWRGVVTGWSRPVVTVAPKTSLTRKDYTDDQQHVRYEILLDTGDAQSMGGSSSGATTAVQVDLEMIVAEEGLTRIRNNKVSEHFSRFDSRLQAFVPNELTAYEYPLDHMLEEGKDQPPVLDARETQLCADIVSGIQDFAASLERTILDETSAPRERGLDLLATIQDRASALAAGDVLPSNLRFEKHVPPTTLAANHLFFLHYLSVELLDFTLRRRASKEHLGKIQYSLGDIVCHKKYGFRGVVVGWDHKPSVDVTRWDGLQDVENPMDIPFYHVIPDQGDCIEAFGGERPHRYVCEANLELCPPTRRLIDVDLEPEWKRDVQDGSYLAPQSILFKYGTDLKDDGITENCMALLHDAINEWQLQAQKSDNDDPAAARLSMTNLVSLLKIVDTLDDALAVQDTIKEVRKAHRRPELRRRLEDGISELLAGKGENARTIFSSMVQDDPEYVEAWNRLATCEFMLGKLDDCQKSTERTLQLDPTHFQAINGLGLIYFERDDFLRAAESFRDSLKLDPWSPVSSKFALCLDLIAKTVEPDELA